MGSNSELSKEDSASSSDAGSSSSELYITPKCYIKMVMHSLRYPHATVNGLIIVDKKSKGNKSVQAVDCIPLFHSGHGLTPMLEVALAQVELQARCSN